ncbi:MAG TPA: DUF3667 domain-containing protein [Ignavibacteria bacterium]|nr:DUF3667 domain-containing protein [Ignavibacteria bacterium]
MIKCKNCGFEFDSNYCPECGQSSNEGRYNFKHLVKDILDVFFKFKETVFPTIHKLINAPAETTHDFLNGKRVHLFNPLKYVFFLALINSFLILQFKLLDAYLKSHDIVSQSITKFYTSNISIIDMLCIPLMSFISFIFFKFKKYNYSEHVILNCYLNGNIYIFGIILSIIQLFFRQNFNLIILTNEYFNYFSILYMVIVYMYFFSEKNPVGFLRASTALLLNYIIYGFILGYFSEYFTGKN